MIKNIRQIRCENASTMDQREELRENGQWWASLSLRQQNDILGLTRLTALKKHNFFPFYDQKLLVKIKRYVSLKKLLCK